MNLSTKDAAQNSGALQLGSRPLGCLNRCPKLDFYIQDSYSLRKYTPTVCLFQQAQDGTSSIQEVFLSFICQTFAKHLPALEHWVREGQSFVEADIRGRR